MSSESVALRFSSQEKPNELLRDVSARFAASDNSEFLAFVAAEVAKLEDPKFAGTGGAEGVSVRDRDGNPRTFKNGLRAAIGLIGEYGPIGYGVRRAQEILRFDGGPSNWSHAFLFHDEVGTSAAELRDPKTSPIIWESSVDLLGPSPMYRLMYGVGPRSFCDYNQSQFKLEIGHCVPNIGVLVYALSEQEVNAILALADSPVADRLRYDFPGLVGTWLAYLLNRTNLDNPLADGKGIYCSAYVQMAYEAAGLDLSPGSHQRNTAPEHLWQGARYFSEDAESIGFSVAGFYCIRDPYCQIWAINQPAPPAPDATAVTSIKSAILSSAPPRTKGISLSLAEATKVVRGGLGSVNDLSVDVSSAGSPKPKAKKGSAGSSKKKNG